MKTLNSRFATIGLIALTSVSLACNRAPEQSASNSQPPAGTETAPPVPAAVPAPAPVPAPVAAAPVAPAAAPVAKPKPAAVKPSAPKTETAAAPAPVPTPVASAPAAPAPPPAPKPVVLEAGTALKVRTTNTLSTKLHKVGDTFEVSLTEPIVVGGKEVVARNTMLMGRVVSSDPGGRVKGVASMAVELNHLHTADGGMLEIATNSFTVEAAASIKKDAVKVGVGAAIGTAIGAIAGGKKGAGIGAAAGAGAGTAAAIGTRGDAAEIAGESVLDFTLRSPITLATK